jgi:integrase
MWLLDTNTLEIEMVGRRISLKDIRSLDEGAVIWDGAVSGFGARRQKSDCVTYLLKYRTAEGRQRWFTIGRHGAPWTPDLARDEAIRILADVKGVSGKKRDPAAEKISVRKATTVAELCDAYLADAEAGRLLTRRQIAKRPSTIATDRGRIEGHIKPLLGTMPLMAITPQDIDSFMHNIAAGKTARQSETKLRKVTHVRGGKGAATRTIGLLGAIFTYAVRHQMCANNPVRGVVRFADGRRERRLTDEEYRSLGAALYLAPHDAVWAISVDATRFLAVTGWRRGEALSLRWSDIDFPRRTAILAETKTGESLRPLSHAACDILSKLEHSREFVFPSVDGESGLRGFPQLWARKLAKLEGFPSGITPHTLRHSYASVAFDIGYSELTIAALIGHKKSTMTSRYVHAADAILLAAADKVAQHILELLG